MVKVIPMRQHFVRPVTSEEEQALQQLYRQGRTHLERRRGQFILLSAKGHDLLHAAQLVGMSRKTAA